MSTSEGTLARIQADYPRLPPFRKGWKAKIRYRCGIAVLFLACSAVTLVIIVETVPAPQVERLGHHAVPFGEKGFNAKWAFTDPNAEDEGFLLVVRENLRPEWQAPSLSEGSDLQRVYQTDREGVLLPGRWLLPGAGPDDRVMGHGSTRLEGWLNGQHLYTVLSDQSPESGFMQVHMHSTGNCFHWPLQEVPYEGALNFTLYDGDEGLGIDTDSLQVLRQPTPSLDSAASFVARAPEQCGERQVKVTHRHSQHSVGLTDATAFREAAEEVLATVNESLVLHYLHSHVWRDELGAFVPGEPLTDPYTVARNHSLTVNNCSLAGLPNTGTCHRLHDCLEAHSRVLSAVSLTAAVPCQCYEQFAASLATAQGHGCPAAEPECWAKALVLHNAALSASCSALGECPLWQACEDGQACSDSRERVWYPCSVRTECETRLWKSRCTPVAFACLAVMPNHCLTVFDRVAAYQGHQSRPPRLLVVPS